MTAWAGVVATGLLVTWVMPQAAAQGQQPAPLTHADTAWCAPPRVLRETARDDFADFGDSADNPDSASRPGGRWRMDAQQAGTLVATGSQQLLDIQTPAGLSLWWRAELQGDYALQFQARALPAPTSAGPLAGRVSDLNLFWNATEADGRAPQPRDGAFPSHDTLRAYYLGFGANGNRSTRLRAYDGQGRRPVLDGWADAPEAGPGDRQGPMTPATRLVAGQWRTLRLVSHAPLEAGGVHGHIDVDGQRLFTLAQPQPLLRGWFALRTTASRLQVRHFQILHCSLP